VDLNRALRGILGLWDGHDAGVALLAEGRLLFALSEERPTRKKRYSGFPRRALDRCLTWARQHDVVIEQMALAGSWGRLPQRLLEPFYAGSSPHRRPLSPTSRAAMRWEGSVASLPGLRAAEGALGRLAVRRRLASALPQPVTVRAIDHHEAHAFSALLGGRRAGAHVVTWDAYGGRTMVTLRCADSPTRVLSRITAPWGLALLYGAVTSELGFREGDEGKITGLAAHGDPERLCARFVDLFRPGDGPPRLLRPLRGTALRALIDGRSRRDVAAGLQAATEIVAMRWLGPVLDSSPGPLLAAGGVFANVALNRALGRLRGLDGLFVFPHMGDGGLAAGAAHRLWYEETGSLADPVVDLALGHDARGAGAEAALTAAGLDYRRVNSAAAAAAAHLLAGRVVCRHSGRDEFGPRALGNRSILFHPTRGDLAARVNRVLGRDAFMPFGPAVLAEHLDEVTAARNVDLDHMTVAVDATDEFRRRCPAAVHVDGTIRPQVVRRSVHPDLHQILSDYHRAGGPPALINTSFNLHGEPIVHTPADAVSTFVASGLDVLLVGDLEVHTEKSVAPERPKVRM